MLYIQTVIDLCISCVLTTINEDDDDYDDEIIQKKTKLFSAMKAQLKY